MDITYLISAHTDAPQFGRLLRSLENEGVRFVVHIDRNVAIHPFIESARGVRNVFFLRERYRISWGTISIVKYQMALIKEALSKAPESFLISLSGLDYPIWPNDKIFGYVNSLRGEELICGSEIGSVGCDNLLLQKEWYSISRPYVNFSFLGAKFNSRIRKLLRIIVWAMGYRKRLYVKLENGERWPLYKGGAWWGISNNLAKKIYSTYQRSRKIQRYFTDLFAPDEVVPQTIAFNSDFRDKCRLIEPALATFNNLSPLHYLEYGKTMKVFTENDFDKIMNSGKAFARKFKTGDSDRLMDMIDSYRTVGCR